VEDIWPIVGWAFNCSIVWKKRWARWKLWLEFFLDVLESDWEERSRLTRNDGAANHLTDSMAARVLQTEDGRTGRRRFMRAIMADGSEKALNEFGEVWKNETKERKKTAEDMKNKRTLNIEENLWGDYDAAEDEDELMIDIMNEIAELEGENGELDMDANKLRQRFLSLVGLNEYKHATVS
jgi:hypothetical protein